MNRFRIQAALICVAASVLAGARVGAQQHEMSTPPLGAGWQLSAMGQAFPVVTVGAPGGVSDDALSHTGWYLTQPAVMAHVASPAHRVVLHTTLNFEGLTQKNGELTFGGWARASSTRDIRTRSCTS